MKKYYLMGLLVAGCISMIGLASQPPPVDQPRVQATGTFVGGGNVLCYGSACAGILDFLSGGGGPLSPEVDPILDPPPVTNSVDKGKFCANMKMAKPQRCSYDSPPSVPGFDRNWIGNGCGDGSMKSRFAEGVAGKVVPNFTGQLDNPLPGISFFGACQAHDQCYGSLIGKSQCDNEFKVRMNQACGLGSSTYAGQCDQLGNAYKQAVTTFGMTAYNDGQNARTCAAWASDMRLNGCPK